LQILSPTGEEHMLVFVREKGKHKVLVAINLSPEKGSVTVNDERLCGKYTHLFSGKKQKVGKTLSLELKPWEYVVLTK
jgi:hypothetical protein